MLERIDKRPAPSDAERPLGYENIISSDQLTIGAISVQRWVNQERFQHDFAAACCVDNERLVIGGDYLLFPWSRMKDVFVTRNSRPIGCALQLSKDEQSVRLHLDNCLPFDISRHGLFSVKCTTVERTPQEVGYFPLSFAESTVDSEFLLSPDTRAPLLYVLGSGLIRRSRRFGTLVQMLGRPDIG